MKKLLNLAEVALGAFVATFAIALWAGSAKVLSLGWRLHDVAKEAAAESASMVFLVLANGFSVIATIAAIGVAWAALTLTISIVNAWKEARKRANPQLAGFGLIDR